MKSKSPGHYDVAQAIRIACRTLDLDVDAIGNVIYEAAQSFNGSWIDLETYASNFAKALPKPRWKFEGGRVIDAQSRFKITIEDNVGNGKPLGRLLVGF